MNFRINVKRDHVVYVESTDGNIFCCLLYKMDIFFKERLKGKNLNWGMSIEYSGEIEGRKIIRKNIELNLNYSRNSI